MQGKAKTKCIVNIRGTISLFQQNLLCSGFYLNKIADIKPLKKDVCWNLLNNDV